VLKLDECPVGEVKGTEKCVRREEATDAFVDWNRMLLRATVCSERYIAASRTWAKLELAASRDAELKEMRSREIITSFSMHPWLGWLIVNFVVCLISFIAYSSQIFIIWPWYGSVLSVELITLLLPFK
jgi:hypothetical protein